jgi:hypothetical protein
MCTNYGKLLNGICIETEGNFIKIPNLSVTYCLPDISSLNNLCYINCQTESTDSVDVNILQINVFKDIYMMEHNIVI